MHNIGTVIRFEVIRSLKKKSFWITAMAFPIVIALIFAIVFFSNQTTEQASLDARNQRFSIAVTDETKFINPELLKQLHATELDTKEAGISSVKQGTVDAYFYYPSALSSRPVEVYAKDVGLFDNNRYQATAEALLTQSATTKTDKQSVSILQKSVNYTAKTFKNGQEYDGIKQLIAPGLFLVLFYILISMFGSQMLSSTTEEKENRVIEMILTTIRARTLIIGKILSLIILAVVQIIAILIPIILIYLVFGSQLKIPNVDLTSLPLDPVRIFIGFVLFSLSYLLFTGLLVAIGAAVPTAREANGFYAVVMMLIFGPLYAVTLFISAPQSHLVAFLSFFPLTAPIPLMLRNAVGNLTTTDTLIGIVILTISAVTVLSVAIHLFQYGALEYSKKLSLKTIFSRQKDS